MIRDPNLARVTGPGRYAPTPTSDLHLGNLRTAVMAWAIARSAGVPFRMRIEDLDQQRVAAAPAVAQQQLSDLAAVGLDWDAPVWVQSERLEHYARAVSTLEVYECYCTRRDIAEASQAPHGSFRPYPGSCRDLSAPERASRRLVRPPALRVRAAGVHQSVFDLFAGEFSAEVDDFVVVRSDGTPAYNLAVVVDDLAMGVQHVTRGRDLLDSAPRQAWLAQQLAARFGGTAPSLWVHLGLVVTAQGQRLAKRDGAAAASDPSQVGRSLGLAGLGSARQLLELAEPEWTRVLAAAAGDWTV